MTTFQSRENYATLIVWSPEQDTFFMEYDDDFDENRLLELDIASPSADISSTSDLSANTSAIPMPIDPNIVAGLARQLTETLEKHNLNLESFSVLSNIIHTEYTPDNTTPGITDRELIAFATVTAKNTSTDLIALNAEDFINQVQVSSVLAPLTKRLVLQASR